MHHGIISVNVIYLLYVTNRRIVLRRFYVELLNLTGQKLNSTLFLMSPPEAREESTPWLNNCSCHPSRKTKTPLSLQHLNSHHKQICHLISGLSQWPYRCMSTLLLSRHNKKSIVVDCWRRKRVPESSLEPLTLCFVCFVHDVAVVNFVSQPVCVERLFESIQVSISRGDVARTPSCFPEAFMMSIIPWILAVSKEN